ncbi:2-amino-3-carboxymuconate-6-semialdehyde decarboxylase [Diplonema papillatum]|nr:2-amino-3-carboxymuconate-6-semialdehyde decarboxylase [Diplonema papillatum]
MADVDWAALMRCEEEGDISGAKAVAPPEEAKGKEESPGDTRSPVSAGGADVRRRKGQVGTGEAVPAQPAGGEASPPPPAAAAAGLQRVLVGYQWHVLLLVLALWFGGFYARLGSVGGVLSDRLWWIGALFSSMLLSLSFRDRDRTQLSAYSIFNPNCERLPGQLTAEGMLGLPTGGPSVGTVRSAPAAAAAARGVDDDLVKALLTQSFGRNVPCPCGSGAKFKTCCMDLQTRLAALKAKKGV